LMNENVAKRNFAKRKLSLKSKTFSKPEIIENPSSLKSFSQSPETKSRKTQKNKHSFGGKMSNI